MAFNVLKSRENPAGEPLYAAAKRLRQEIEGQMIASGPACHEPSALQAVGLLLQLEAVDRAARAGHTLHLVDLESRLPETEAKARA